MTLAGCRRCNRDPRRRRERPRTIPGVDGHRLGEAHSRGGPRCRACAGKGRRSWAGLAARAASRRGPATKLVGAGSRRSRSATAREVDAGAREKTRLVGDLVTHHRCPLTQHRALGDLRRPRDPDRAQRGCAQRRGRIDGLGNPVADDPGATVGQDCRGGWQRCGDIAENHRTGRTVLAQRAASHCRQGPPRHVRLRRSEAQTIPSRTFVNRRLRAARTERTA
jgi:hypothetical protein